MKSQNELIVYPRLRKMLTYSVIMVAIGIVLTILGVIPEEPNIFVTVLGIICTVFFGLCLSYYIYRSIHKKPAIVVNAEGIRDHSSYSSGGFIPWTDIREVSLYNYMNQHFIGIHLHDTEQYIAKQSGFKKLLMKMNSRIVDAPVSISDNGIDMKITDLYKRIGEQWQEATK